MSDKSYENFEKIINAKGISAYKVSKETGVSTVTLSNWKSGKYTPKADKLQAICDYLEVDMGMIIEAQKKDNAPKPENAIEHIQLISLYEKLTEEQKQAILTIMSSMVK